MDGQQVWALNASTQEELEAGLKAAKQRGPGMRELRSALEAVMRDSDEEVATRIMSILKVHFLHSRCMSIRFMRAEDGGPSEQLRAAVDSARCFCTSTQSELLSEPTPAQVPRAPPAAPSSLVSLRASPTPTSLRRANGQACPALAPHPPPRAPPVAAAESLLHAALELERGDVARGMGALTLQPG